MPQNQTIHLEKLPGTSFTVDGKPFFVAGVSNHYLLYGTDTEVNDVLDDAVALGANVVRTFLQSVIGSPDDDRTTIWKFHNPPIQVTAMRTEPFCYIGIRKPTSWPSTKALTVCRR